MKKKIIISIFAILVLIIAGVLAFILFDNETKPPEETSENMTSVKEESLEKRIFSLVNYDDLTALAADFNLEVNFFSDNTLAQVDEFVFFGSSSDLTVTLDAEEKIDYVRVYSRLFDSSVVSSDENGRTVEENVYNECRDIIIAFARLFGVQYTGDLQLTYYDDGTFSNVNEAKDMTDIINEKAYMNFAVRDEAGYYYVMNIVWFESGLEATIEKYYDVEGYIDYLADISLFEED